MLAFHSCVILQYKGPQNLVLSLSNRTADLSASLLFYIILPLRRAGESFPQGDLVPRRGCERQWSVWSCIVLISSGWIKVGGYWVSGDTLWKTNGKPQFIDVDFWRPSDIGSIFNFCCVPCANMVFHLHSISLGMKLFLFSPDCLSLVSLRMNILFHYPTRDFTLVI